MATSGSIDFSLTAGDVIDYALRKLRILDAGETAAAVDTDDAKEELNLLLKTWQKHEFLWVLTEAEQTLAADTASYTLSPVPHRVISARYDDQDTEIPARLMSREEYFDLPDKTSTGIPTNYYVDYQRATATLYVWPLLTTFTDETFNYTYQRRIEDIDALTNDIDIRQEHLQLIGYTLAMHLIPQYGRAGTQDAQLITAQATKLLNEALDEDREDEVRFTMEYD